MKTGDYTIKGTGGQAVYRGSEFGGCELLDTAEVERFHTSRLRQSKFALEGSGRTHLMYTLSSRIIVRELKEYKYGWWCLADSAADGREPEP